MCCCGCCSKLLKCVCGIVWSVIALALIVVLIIIAVAWGGSGVAQDVVKNLINCNGQTYSEKNCPKNFGTYIAGICDEGNYDLKCEGIDTLPNKFKYTIHFKPQSKKNLGTYVRMSNKGIEETSDYIINLNGNIDGDEGYPIDFRVPVYTYDENGNEIRDKKKQFIVHNRYAHIELVGDCTGTCPNETFYEIDVITASVHIRVSFKTVPDWINVHIDNDYFKYNEFVDSLYKVIKPFSKSAAKTMKEAMTTLKIRVKNFDVDGEHKLCSISPDYDHSLDSQ